MSQTGSATRQGSEDIVLSRIRDFVLLAFVLIAGAVAGWASPVSSKLLKFVPEGAQIVAGIEDPHNPTSSGRLLLVTHSCNLDFKDWVAITGVDPHREPDEVIEVATSSSEGEFKEHLVRWLAILDDRTTIFEAPELVRQAVDRYLSGAGPDPMLVERLRQLHPDVNSWNVLLMTGPMLTWHVAPGQLHAPWTHTLDGADELTVGIHYGSTDRIDFAVHAVSSQTTSSLARLAGAPRVISVDLSTSMRPRLRNLSVEGGRVRGSFLVPGEQFERWLASVYTRSPSASIPQP
jgi:hypothetical protein